MRTQLEKYIAKVSKAKSKGELLAKLRSMDVSLAAGGLAIAEAMTEEDFTAWRNGVQRYLDGVGNPSTWEDQYLDLLIPTPVALMQRFLEEGGSIAEDEA